MLEKHEDYFSSTRFDLVEFVDKGDNKILELGCGEGNTCVALKSRGKAIEVVGVEKDPKIAQIARMKVDKVICADIEAVELPFSEGYFDYVIIGDVLEHLYNPWILVNRLGRYLKRGGYVIASIPNIRNWRIIKDLVLKGEWKYCSEGLLDETHLRFFTKKGVLGLFQSECFFVTRIIPRFKLLPTGKAKIVNSLAFGLLEEFLAVQYVVKVRKL